MKELLFCNNRDSTSCLIVARCNAYSGLDMQCTGLILSISLFLKDSLLKPYENGYIELLNASYDANMAEIPLQIFDIEYPAEDGIFANLSIRVTPDFDDLAAMKLWIELNSDK